MTVHRWWRHLAAFVFVAALASPIAVVVLYSFTDAPSFAFPPRNLTADAYMQFASPAPWLDAMKNTLMTATLVGAAATVRAVLAVLAGDGNRTWSSVTTAIAIVPLFISPVIVSVAYFLLFERYPPLRPIARVVAAQVTMAFPFVYLVCRDALQEGASRFPTVARSLGASEWHITALRVRLAWAPIGAAFTLGFLVSAGDPIAPIFLGSVPYETLAQKAGEGIRYGIDPRANVAALIVVSTVVLGSVAVGVLAARGGPEQ